MTLIGEWITDSSDLQTVEELGDVLLDFRADRQLIYTQSCDGQINIIKLTYYIDGDCIVTDQPSSPSIERTRFAMSSEGVLTLAFGGKPYRFVRPT